MVYMKFLVFRLKLFKFRNVVHFSTPTHHKIYCMLPTVPGQYPHLLNFGSNRKH